MLLRVLGRSQNTARQLRRSTFRVALDSRIRLQPIYFVYSMMLTVYGRLMYLVALSLVTCSPQRSRLPQDRPEKLVADHGGGFLQLREVNMSGCKELTDVGLTAIGGLFILEFEGMVLQGCVKLTDSSIFSVAEGLKHSPALEMLDLSW